MNWSSDCAPSRPPPRRAGHQRPAAPAEADLRAPERIAIDYGNAAELADKCGKALQALEAEQPAAWKALRAQGIFRGHGPAPKVAFLYTGQGSQYVNMLRGLRAAEPIVAAHLRGSRPRDDADPRQAAHRFIFVDPADTAAVARAEDDLTQTAITQPAVLASDLALTRLLEAYGIRPDMTMGHSLGEYGALVAAGALPFDDALEAVAARGREMTRVAMADNGRMAAVFAPLAEIERILHTVDGYVVIANLNSDKQAVIGGASRAVEQASEALLNAGYNVVPLNGQPRIPYVHRGARQRAVAPHAGAAAAHRAQAAGGGQRGWPLLPHRPGRQERHARHPGAAGRFAGAVRARAADAL